MEEKIFFKEGDLVTIRQDVPNKPVMMVEKVEKLHMPVDNASNSKSLLGIRTLWFDKNGALHKNRFNFKDLVLV